MPSAKLKVFTKKIGTGPKLAKDLTEAEAYEAMTEIVSGKASPTQLGAFLIALRIKSESPEEVAGMVRALREKTNFLQHDFPTLLELAPAFDGKKKTLVLSPFVAMALAQTGISVVVTGGRDIPTKKGITPALIFASLGFDTTLSAAGVLAQLRDKNFAYYDVSQFCPLLEGLKPIRDEFGLRTPLNTFEKILNPSVATHIATGVFHGPYLQAIAGGLNLLKYANVLCVQATEASTDLSVKRRSLYHLVRDGVVGEQSEFEPATVGLKQAADAAFVEASVADNLSQVRAALKAKTGVVYDSLLFTVSAQLFFLQKFPTVGAALPLSKELLAAVNF